MALNSPLLLPFVVPLALTVAFTVLQFLLILLGGISLGLETDIDVEVDLDLDADVDVDVDLDADVDADVDADADVDHGAGMSLLRLLAPLGVGRVPLSVVGQAFGLSFGVSGLLLSYAAHRATGALIPLSLVLTLPLSFLLGCLGTQRIVRLVVPFLRVSGKAESQDDLVGKTGRVTSLRVDAEYGEVCLQVNGGSNYVVVRSNGEQIDRGNTVVVVSYDVKKHRAVVAPLVSPTPTSIGGTHANIT